VIRRVLIGGIAAALVLIALPARAQTAAEHASHHPGGGAPAAPGMAPGAPMGAPAAPPAAPGMAGGAAPSAPAAQGMAGMMADMMAPAASGGCMGGNCGSSGAAKTPIYPSLMTLPALTPEKRAEIEALASQQLNEGMGRLATGAESLERATQAGDHAAMQQSVGLMREGLDELGAGIAARRVLSEGKAPRNLALDWFKREMNLASPIAPEEPRAVLGVSPFHLFTMVLLIAFALAMVAMYFFKMRRAAALFGRLEPDNGSPPPGGLPPPSAAPTPSSSAAPPAGKPPVPASGATPPAAPSSPATPAAGTPVASALPPGGPAAVSVSEATSASPLTANWRGQLRIGSIVTETPNVKTFRILPSSNDRFLPFTFVPGQFLNLAFGIGGARMNRSYSISSSPTQREYVDLTVRREPRGAVSRHINDLLEVGDQIEAGGPIGRFTFTGTEADSIVLIAAGVGITPMMSITRYLTERSWAGDIFFIYTCRTPADFIFATEVAALQRVNPKLRVAVTMSRPEGTDWKGPRGRITKELLTQTVPNLASRRIHVCGPPSMMDSIKAILTELGAPPDQVKTEAFGATKPTPAAAGTTAKSTAPATGPLVTFSKNNKSAKIHVDQTVLELSEELAIGIEFSCRVGTCGVCKVKMTSGEVEMEVQDALEPDDMANGIILACQAKPKGDIAVEA
jgi:ferredoxin-NADP reductase